MPDWKKVIKISILLVLIGVCAVMYKIWIVDRDEPPDWVLETMEEKIDHETLETVTLSVEEWRKLGENGSGLIKNPKTGKYTMAPLIICMSCGEKIPAPVAGLVSGIRAEEPPPPPPDEEFVPDFTGRLSRSPASGGISRSGYKCPKCGRRAR